jgi:hypothetical protein
MQPVKGNRVATVRLQGFLQVQGEKQKFYIDIDVGHPFPKGIFKNVQGSGSTDLTAAQY